MTDQSSSTTTFKLYRQRWLVLFSFAWSSAATGVLWISVASVTLSAMEFYDVGPTAINGLSASFMVLYVPTSFAASWTLDKYGLAVSVWLGAILNGLGAFVRALGGQSPTGFIWLAAGQIIAAAAQPFLLAAPSKLASNWFAQSETGTATSLATLANSCGIAIGYLMGPSMVEYPSDVPSLLNATAIFTLVASLISLLGVREAPPTAPSVTATSERQSFREGLSTLATNKSFWVLAGIIGLSIGAFNAVATLLNQMVEPYNYDGSVTGNLGATIIFAGLIGSYIAGRAMDAAYRSLRKIMIVITIGGLLGCVSLALALGPDRAPLLFVVVASIGIFYTAMFPVGFVAGIETAHPVGEGTSAGILMMAGQLFGVPATLIGGAMGDPRSIAWWIVAWSIAACLLLPWLHVPYSRSGDESDSSSKKESSASPGQYLLSSP